MPHQANKTMKTIFKIITLAAMVALSGCVSGCGTTAPKPVTAQRPSFDVVPDAKGNNANSGGLVFTNHLLLITPTARDRYNALCVKWGKKLVPPVVPPDAGLTLQPGTTNRWLIDKDHLDKWSTMNLWESQPATSLGVKPP